MFSNLHCSPFFVARYFAPNATGTEGGANNSNNNGEGDNNQQNNQEGNQQGDPATFEDWYKALPADHQTLFAPAKAHFERMQATVKATRDERDDFSRQLRDATKKLKEGSEERQAFEGLSAQLDEANRRADFHEDAPSHKCLNSKAAYAIAKSQDLFDKKGGVDWARLEETAPELFGEAKPKLPKKGGAGNGTNNNQSARKGTMNDWIRNQAGVTPSE